MRITPLAVPLVFLVVSLPVCAAPVTGRIVDDNQKPVAGAKVKVSLLGEGNPKPQDLVTDADGVFTAEIPDEERPKVEGTLSYLGQLMVVVPGLAQSQFDWKQGGETFTLAPGQSWGGVVLGEDEKPLAGVAVVVKEVRVAGKTQYLKTSAQTDDQGRWKIDNLPRRGNAKVFISDPRYQAQGFEFSLSKAAPPLWAQPGAVVRGRLLKPDGSPLANVFVNSWKQGGDQVRTDAEGHFSLFGFEPGNVSLHSFAPPSSFGKFAPAEPFLVLPREVEALKLNESRDIGDWKGEAGILVSGHVVDQVTKKPIAGASAFISDEVAPSTQHYTDEQGYFEIRVSSAGASSASFSDDNYLGRNLNNLSIPKGATAFTLPTIELVPGVKVTGNARIEGGASFGTGYSAFGLTATGSNGETKVAYGQSSGNFTFGALSPGKYGLKAGWPDNYGGLTNLYSLVSPTSFTVPSAGQPMGSLEVVLKPEATKEGSPTQLVGRVIDEAGRGVTGAIVSFKNGNYSNPIQTVSGEDGVYEISDLASDAKLSIEGISRPGYVGAGTPQTNREGDTLRVADFVVKRRGSRFVGRILDAEGKPAAGALIIPLELAEMEPVKSAADGTFVLLDLPDGEFTLLATKDRLSSMQKSTAKTNNVELRLVAPAPIDAAALVEKWLARGGGWWGEGDFDSGWGVERMEQLALRGAKTGPLDERAAQIFGWFLDAAAQHEPAWTRKNADRLLAMFPNGPLRRAAESSVAPLRAASPDLDDRKAAGKWLRREKAEAGGVNPETVGRYLTMARVALALELPEAPGLLDFAAQITDQMSAQTRLSLAAQWGKSLSRQNEAALVSFIENWEAPARLAAWGGAGRGWAARDDIESARHALTMLEELAKDPSVVAANANETRFRSYETTPGLAIESVRSALVRALSERDPAEAFRISEGIDDQFAHQNALLWVANGARLRGDTKTATTALRQVFEFRIGNTEPFALAAWYGAQIDPALGQELFARERSKLAEKSIFGSRASVGDLAYYIARLDPAQSRILVEREWQWRTPSFGKKNDFGDIDRAPTKLVRAMLVIDPTRAVEMIAQLETAEAGIPDDGGQRGRERRGWITALTADAAAIARGDLSTWP
jgi:hypothetical protein